MLAFRESSSHGLSIFLQTHSFWNFDHISRSCNQINYKNILFPIMIFIMTPQVLFFGIFSEKDTHLNAVEYSLWVGNSWNTGSFLYSENRAILQLLQYHATKWLWSKNLLCWLLVLNFMLLNVLYVIEAFSRVIDLIFVLANSGL